MRASEEAKEIEGVEEQKGGGLGEVSYESRAVLGDKNAREAVGACGSSRVRMHCMVEPCTYGERVLGAAKPPLHRYGPNTTPAHSA